MQQVAPRLVIKRIIVLEGIVNRGRLLRRLLRRLGLLLGLRSRHAGRGNVIVARRLEGVRLVRRLRFTAASQPYRLLGRSSSRSGLLGRSRRHASSHIVRISVELATLLESGVLAHDEAREDAEEDADRAHNDAHQKHLALTVGAAEDHRHRATRVQESEESASHVGVHKTEVLPDKVLELAQSTLEEDEESREAATISGTQRKTLHAVDHHEGRCESQGGLLRQQTDGVAQNQGHAEDNVAPTHHSDHRRSLRRANPIW